MNGEVMQNSWFLLFGFVVIVLFLCLLKEFTLDKSGRDNWKVIFKMKGKS